MELQTAHELIKLHRHLILRLPFHGSHIVVDGVHNVFRIERLEAVSTEVWKHYIVVFEGCLRANPTTVQQVYVQQCVARQQAQDSHWLCDQAH
jgi:hypothetical protein